MNIPDYQALDHTGDLAWKVVAPNFEALLTKASLALSDTLVEVSKVEALSECRWEVNGETWEALLVAQLQEILYQFDAKGMIFRDFEIQSSGNRLQCFALGEKLNPEKHGFKTEIKAVTYHQLRITEDREGNLEATVVLDV